MKLISFSHSSLSLEKSSKWVTDLSEFWMQGTRRNFLLGLFGDLLGIQEKEASELNPGCDISKDQTDFPGEQSNWISLTRRNHSMIFLRHLLQVIS